MTEYEHSGSSTDIQAIDRLRVAHVAAVNSGNAAAWVAQFADDGVQMPPNAPANVGRKMIGSWSQAFLDQFHLQFALAVDEVHVLGNWAFERGRYKIGLNAKAGGPQMCDIGKYITVCQRTPGDTWRIARDIWNSSNPPLGSALQ